MLSALFLCENMAKSFEAVHNSCKIGNVTALSNGNANVFQMFNELCILGGYGPSQAKSHETDQCRAERPPNMLKLGGQSAL